MTEPADYTPAELDLLEARSDPLIDLVGYAERYRPSSPAYDDARFLRWIARDRREWAHDPELLESKELLALRNRIVATAHAARLGVSVIGSTPERERFDVAAPVGAVIVDMERSRRAAVCDLAIAAGPGRELWDVEVDSCIPLPDDLPRGKYLALTVRGDSMEPLIHTGDVVLVRVGDKLVRDTVVVARDIDGGYVVKKVGRIRAKSIELESLNPVYPAMRIARVPRSILGTVLLRWCDHGEAALSE
ncbi:MAG TPA: S24 family peptidase [Gemmatimonadaceae bacterium]|jgi:SOS-response transcriptional repressor LexA